MDDHKELHREDSCNLRCGWFLVDCYIQDQFSVVKMQLCDSPCFTMGKNDIQHILQQMQPLLGGAEQSNIDSLRLCSSRQGAAARSRQRGASVSTTRMVMSSRASGQLLQPPVQA